MHFFLQNKQTSAKTPADETPIELVALLRWRSVEDEGEVAEEGTGVNSLWHAELYPPDFVFVFVFDSK